MGKAAIAFITLALSAGTALAGTYTPTEVCNRYDAIRAEVGRGPILVSRGVEVIANASLAQLRTSWARAGKPHANLLLSARSYMPGSGVIVWIPREHLGTAQCIVSVTREAGWAPARHRDPGVVYSDRPGLMMDPHASDHF